MKKRFFRGLFAGVLAAAVMAAPASAFTDTEGHWASYAIQKWSEEYSLIQGYDDGTFRPDHSITRGAFAGILGRFLKFQDISPADTFSDTEGTYWEEAVLKLHAAGVYLGNGGKALASDTITRQQAITMIGRAFQITPEALELSYADEALVAGYARDYLATMTARGYINDTVDNCFRPTEPITRAELLNILNNMVELLVQTPELITLQEIYGTVLINSSDGATLDNVVIHGDLILAPGVQGVVTLCDVLLMGELRNFSDVEPVILDLTAPEEEEPPVEEEDAETEPLRPEDVYTPGETTGEYFMYNGKRYPVYEGRDPLQVTAEDFYWEEDRLIYQGDAFDTRFGIDVSAYQNRASENRTIDWDAVRDDGVDFAMVRIGFRGTGTGSLNADEYYAENIEGAMAAGLETGVYFFAQAITVEEAIEEAEFVLELLEEHDINGPVAYDWEMHDSSYRVYGTEPEMATACAVAFCERVAEAGYTPMIYAGQYVSYIKYDQGAIAPYLFWYPEYKNTESELWAPTVYYQMDYWQFTSNCQIDGIGGTVDANIQFIR